MNSSEFKDISYSDRGMAVYHGWLPLYALAASFALHHVKPEQSNSSLDSRYGLEESRRLTRAGRIPSVVFGLVFLVVAFAAGNAFYGKDAGWIALLTATVHPAQLYLSRQARYYSATVALSTGCCLLVWLMITKGRWRDYLLGAILFVLLFHTHLLSFVAAASVFALTMPVMLNRRRFDLKKVGAFGSIIAAGTVPWVILTEFHRHQSRIPRGWSLLSLPAHFFRYLPVRPISIVIGLAFLLLLVWLNRAKREVPSRLRSPFLPCLFPTLFLAAWIVSGYLSFILCMPAASFYTSRLNLSYCGAALLLGSMICASIVRVVMPRFTTWSVAAGMALMMAIVGPGLSLTDSRASGNTKWSALEQVVDQLEALKLRKETKLYAIPNDHLVLMFYTGLPLQSIAPVRKSFLDRYPGDVVIVDSVRNWRAADLVLTWAELQKAAMQGGQSLSRRDAEDLSAELLARDYQQTVIRNVTGVSPSTMEGVPPFARTAWQEYQAQIVSPSRDDFLMIRGFSVANWRDCMDLIFYRFVNPESRRGSNRNDVQRLRGARAFALIPSGFVVFHSRGGSTPGESAGVDFTFVRQAR